MRSSPHSSELIKAISRILSSSKLSTYHFTIAISSKMPACSFCNKSYHSNSLKRHVETEHTVKERYRCTWPECTKHFSQEDNLREHMRTHNDQWLQCSKCIFISKQSSEMTRHKQAHHGHPKRGQAGEKVDHFTVSLTETEATAIKEQITPEDRRLTRRMRSTKAAPSSSRRAPHTDYSSLDVKPSVPQASSSSKVRTKRSKPAGGSHPYRRPARKVEEVQEPVELTSPEFTYPWNTPSPSAPSFGEYRLPLHHNQPSSSSSSPPPFNPLTLPCSHGTASGELCMPCISYCASIREVPGPFLGEEDLANVAFARAAYDYSGSQSLHGQFGAGTSYDTELGPSFTSLQQFPAPGPDFSGYSGLSFSW